jgi:uncharacterized protein (TIGR02271 family)
MRVTTPLYCDDAFLHFKVCGSRKVTGIVFTDLYLEHLFIPMKKDSFSNTSYNRPGESRKISVLEEDLQLGIKQKETGRVRAIKKVHEEDLLVSGPVLSDELKVERIPFNQYIDEAPPGIRYEGETMIIPVVEEEVIIQTRLKLVEEVRITKRQVEKTVEKPVTLRKEEIVIQRAKNENTDV